MGKCSCVAPYRKNGNNTYGLNCGAGVTVVSYPRATLRQQQLEALMVFPQTPFPETTRVAACAICSERRGGTGPISAARLLNAALHPSSDHCSVYVALDNRDAVLYVGITTGGLSRFNQHATESHWWLDVDRLVIRHFACRHDALDVEAFLIATLDPEWNTQRPKRDGRRGRQLAERADFERDMAQEGAPL